MFSLDTYLYELSNIFLVPVQIAVVFLFIYACFSLGGFASQFIQRFTAKEQIKSLNTSTQLREVKGHELLRYALANPNPSREDLELTAAKELEFLRITTRIGPMLGLVATMIPMGPALKALANGNVQGISENLIIAFTAVIFSLLAAAITFWIASVRKQWLIEDIRFIENWYVQQEVSSLSEEEVSQKNPKDVDLSTSDVTDPMIQEVAPHAA